MKNEIEISAYIATEDGIRIEARENIFYGEEAQWRSHGFRCQSALGHPLRIRIPIEQYFDYIATTIPEKYRTERIKKWIELKNSGADMRGDKE